MYASASVVPIVRFTAPAEYLVEPESEAAGSSTGFGLSMAMQARDEGRFKPSRWPGASMVD